MATFIRCPECSFCVGKYAEFFECAKQAIYSDAVFGDKSKYANYDPEKMVFNPNITISLEHLFDALKIKNRCCRMHMVAKTEFDKIYK
jgi:hypothetical protein